MWMGTLPETNIALENRPKANRKVVFQPSIFRGYVSFRECNYFNPEAEAQEFCERPPQTWWIVINGLLVEAAERFAVVLLSQKKLT